MHHHQGHIQGPLADEGNYIVNSEANGKHGNPIWLLTAELIANRVGGRQGERSGGSNRIL